MIKKWASSSPQKSLHFAFSFSQNASDVERSDKHYKFEKKRVLLQYDDANSLVTEYYHIFMTRSRPHSIIKSSKSGRALLDKTTNWKDCGAWFTVRTISNHWENVCLFIRMSANLAPGASFSNVPRIFRARKASCQTAICLFEKADLLTCFWCKINWEDYEVWSLRTSALRGYR